MITNKLLKLDKTLSLYMEGNWDVDLADGMTKPHKHPLYLNEVGQGNYISFNDAGVECEVGEFLYGLVRTMKPTKVLETGTHLGIGASYLGMGLKANGFGKLDTIEFLPELHERAKKRIETLKLNDFVSLHREDAAVFDPLYDNPLTGSDFSDADYVAQRRRVYDIVFLDTEPEIRFSELTRYFEYTKYGGFILVHDLHRHLSQEDNKEHGFGWPFGELPKRVKDMFKNDLLRPMHFPTPRGLSMFYKVHPNDYQWRK